MSDRVYRVTRDPKLLGTLLAQSQHTIVKQDNGSFRCVTHGGPAQECAPKSSAEHVWSNSLDRGKYRASVVRVKPYWGRLVLTREGIVILEQMVTISYDAPFGADLEDVREWERICIAAADADYRSRGQEPPGE